MKNTDTKQPTQLICSYSEIPITKFLHLMEHLMNRTSVMIKGKLNEKNRKELEKMLTQVVGMTVHIKQKKDRILFQPKRDTFH